MRASALALLALALLAPALACGDDVAETSATTGSDTTGGAEPHATFEATVDQLGLCGVIGAQNLVLRASRVGCIGSPPAPCTLPTDPYKAWVGDVAACPSASTSTIMRVAVPTSGRYQIEVVTNTESGMTGECFGAGGDDVLDVTDADLDDRRVIGVQPLGGPCPAP